MYVKMLSLTAGLRHASRVLAGSLLFCRRANVFGQGMSVVSRCCVCLPSAITLSGNLQANIHGYTNKGGPPFVFQGLAASPQQHAEPRPTHRDTPTVQHLQHAFQSFPIALGNMSPVVPFKISVSDERLARLQQKLALTEFPDECTDATNWCHGPPLSDVKRLAHRWNNGFDWRAAEASLNKFPQYTTQVEMDGFDQHDLHFIHQRSQVENAIPLLFVHGWPGSFIEVTRVVSQLVQGGNDFPAFHVVAPSLVDFGFSSASKRKDFGIAQQAEAVHKVMLALGYKEYVVQAGDLGYLVARFLALTYPEHVKAHHISNAAPAEPNVESHPELHAKMKSSELSPSELEGLGRTEWFSKEGNGYYKKQATKPQTVGYFMADSPVGLLAWLLEALHDWVDDYRWTDDEILTWVSIYYFSQAGPAASSYIYYAMEHADTSPFVVAQKFSEVPLGISRFPKDLILLPKLWNHTLGPIIFEKEHQQGGHFAAWENPEAIVDDLRTMFGKKGGAFGVVGAKSGYND
jgi:pimeloyl-ACP methyl ester carboxylesterase